jgi:hypothetical protein
MDSPELLLFSRPAGSSKALVFIDGFLSGKKERCGTLLSALNYTGWNHSVYQLWWDASSLSHALETVYKVNIKSVL